MVWAIVITKLATSTIYWSLYGTTQFGAGKICTSCKLFPNFVVKKFKDAPITSHPILEIFPQASCISLHPLTLSAPTPQNGQTCSNNSSANCLSVFHHFVGLVLIVNPIKLSYIEVCPCFHKSLFSLKGE